MEPNLSARGQEMRHGEDRASAFSELIQNHLQSSYRLATAITRNGDLAQDAVQEAVVAAWARWSTLRDEARFGRWFDRIVVNKCLDELRRERKARVYSPIPETTEDRPHGELDSLESLREALEALRPDHRVVVVMRYLDDLTVRDIAELTGMRVGTVKSRLHYGLRQLRAAYDAAERRDNPDG